MATDTLRVEGDTTFIGRTWDTYGKSMQHIDYKVSKAYDSSAQMFRTFKVKRPWVASSEDYWKSIYSQIYLEQKDQVRFVTERLEKLQQVKKYDRNDFARVIVSLVQDIPYTLVLDLTKCEDDKNYKGPCISNVKYGLYTPVEFLYHLKGDCDTRTLLLYTLLKQFDYSPIIMVSKEYQHSVLAVDIQTTGDYILHNGKKYYFWETTAKGWDAGVLPPGSRVKSYWKKTLT
ncbi:MAG: hypothetical protein ACPGYY_08930 [Bacteroidia bacterium]